jgi:hypothetical protein
METRSLRRQGSGTREREPGIPCRDEKPELAAKQSLEEILSRPIGSLDLGNAYHAKRAVRALEAAGIETIGDALAAVPLEKLAGIRGIGPATVERIRIGLGSLGLKASFKPRIRLRESGQLETNLSYEQLGTLIRIAKLELAELRDDLQPHRIKVIGELLDLVEVQEGRGGR